MISQCHYVLEIAEKVLPIYETVFDVEFPLPKLDTLVRTSTFVTTTVLIYRGPILDWKLRCRYVLTCLSSACRIYCSDIQAQWRTGYAMNIAACH